MSYQVLARKWRPKTFREMVGQEHVLKALINALDHNRLHHAYLFTGTRGVGKTTIARILAKCLNCEVGVSSEPCGQCSACESIVDGRFVDLIEVDAASRTKVEDTRELLENVQYAPTSGRYKVYLIDEVHMLSTHSFNALLKTLEEPPPHVKFLLATTDPQKLPATILSRCLQFNLKNMSPERIVGHLKNVLEQEMVAFEEPALWLIGRAADGSMRDGLSLTDQAISYGSGKLQEVDVAAMLGTIDRTDIYDIVQALASSDASQVLAAVAHLSEHAPDYSSALEELLTMLHRIAITQAVPEANDNSFGDADRISQLAASMTAEDVQLFYQIGLNGRRDLPLAPDMRSGFEMALLRMLAFKPTGVVDLPTAAVTNTAVATGGVKPVKKPEAGPAPAQAESRQLSSATDTTDSIRSTTPAPAKIEPALKDLEDTVAIDKLPSKAFETVLRGDQAKDVSANSSELKAPVSPVSVAKSGGNEAIAPANDLNTNADNKIEVEKPVADTSNNSQSETKNDLSFAQLTAENWCSQFEALGFGGVVGSIASHCVVDRKDGDVLHLTLDEKNATLFSDNYTSRIQQHLRDQLQHPLTVKIEVKAVNIETPAEYKRRLQQERRAVALATLKNDPNVQALVADFAAELNEDSVQPL